VLRGYVARGPLVRPFTVEYQAVSNETVALLGTLLVGGLMLLTLNFLVRSCRQGDRFFIALQAACFAINLYCFLHLLMAVVS